MTGQNALYSAKPENRQPLFCRKPAALNVLRAAFIGLHSPFGFLR
jgi:hypothetical protein